MDLPQRKRYDVVTPRTPDDEELEEMSPIERHIAEESARKALFFGDDGLPLAQVTLEQNDAGYPVLHILQVQSPGVGLMVHHA